MEQDHAFIYFAMLFQLLELLKILPPLETVGEGVHLASFLPFFDVLMAFFFPNEFQFTAM